MPAPRVQALLIDDDEDEYVLVRALLEDSEEAIELEWEPDYDLARNAMRQRQDHVFLVDYRLGQRTGLELLQDLRAEGINRAVIMLTGMGGDEIDRSAMEAGVYDYLVKGEFSGSELRRSIRYAFERFRTEQQLRRQAEILSNIHDGVCLFDSEGVIRTWNRAAEAVFGYSEDQVLGRHIGLLIAPGNRDRFLERTANEGLETAPADFTCLALHQCGKPIWIAARASLLRDESGAPEGTILCANDISERKALEQQLLEISESEQRRIGQDLHDDLCQQLAGIACLAGILARKVKTNDKDSGEELIRIETMISNANSRAREIARGLVPATLASDGLVSALGEFAAQTSHAFDIKCRLKAPDNLQVSDPRVGTQLFRIAQEAVSNGIRHGRATAISLILESGERGVTMKIQDNGSGMDNSRHAKKEPGMGISTMTHRARMLGGDLIVHSTAEGGTVVECSIPCFGESPL